MVDGLVERTPIRIEHSACRCKLSLTAYRPLRYFPALVYDLPARFDLTPSRSLAPLRVGDRIRVFATGGEFSGVMKLSGGLSYIGALPQARSPIACGHYLSACRLHRLRYLRD